MVVVVDAYGPEERAMGWYCYLEKNVTPFTAACAKERSISTPQKGDEVKVTGIADSDECEHKMLVMIRYEGKRGLAVPLAQLKPGSDSDAATRQAVEDWLYWVKMAYEF